MASPKATSTDSLSGGNSTLAGNATPTASSAAPQGLSAVASLARRDALTQAGLPAGGTGPALQSRDRNGRNIVVLSVRGFGRTGTLQADHVAFAGGGRRVLRHVSPATLKVLVLQNGSKYILRGETDVRFAGGPTPAPPADPVGSRWLAGTYRPAVERFNRYQRTVERYPSPAAAAPSG